MYRCTGIHSRPRLCKTVRGGWCSDARKAEGGFHPRQDSSSSQSRQEAWEPREQTETPHRVGIKPTTFSLWGDGTDRRTTAAPLRISRHINFSERFFEICPTSRPHARFCLCSGGKTGVSVKLARNCRLHATAEESLPLFTSGQRKALPCRAPSYMKCLLCCVFTLAKGFTGGGRQVKFWEQVLYY